jgi:hypothetical protein
MSLRWLGVSFAFTFALAAQPAAANQDVACPEGQAIRAIGDKTAVCVPVPPPANLAPLNAAINAETAARAAGDAALQGAINDEIAARKAAGEELPDRLDVTILNGSYAFTGTASCLSSSRGFNSNLSPTVDVLPGQGNPTIVGSSSQSVTGVRTFDGRGSGNISATFHTINYPSLFYFLNSQPGMTSFAGGGNVATLTGTFSYEVTPEGLLIITDQQTTGTIIKGSAALVGATTTTVNLPQSTGHLGKDLKSISITHDDVAVETLIVTPVGGTPQSTPRICYRERTLLKLKSSG